MDEKREIILVTDGDVCAKKAIEKAVQQIGGRCISKSGGNPTPINSSQMIKLIKSAKYDPVVVMVDDEGNQNYGIGEKIIYDLYSHPDIDIIGVLVVASNTPYVKGVHVDFSVDASGNIVRNAVDKEGDPIKGKILFGDTVDIVDECKFPLVVGIGDIGKMKGKDDICKGAPIVTKALKEIINRHKEKDSKLLH
ncbi:stage V sporulation protein AE [Serpentinicella alkaliphila]|uniref:Stage V sporulation protein AE n=1 Tax=Serpentinicella alkaliphila TaxID=1734049 RepID=A0A4R2TIL6_9FIRM|nr:stage V sporulation protein AE [Serpentinicella alkaliphila]QUH26017.1 stage V sporulation protein AE [Serpentinicella alkaliphila]TCQ02122.1 stage V sporulation protein AE [Serpentinicella alkaliphila]